MSDGKAAESNMRGIVRHQADTITRLTADNKRLRAALKPFADESLRFLPHHDFGVLKRCDCDAARAALSGEQQ